MFEKEHTPSHMQNQPGSTEAADLGGLERTRLEGIWEDEKEGAFSQ